jgi:hypothetical protein
MIGNDLSKRDVSLLLLQDQLSIGVSSIGIGAAVQRSMVVSGTLSPMDDPSSGRKSFAMLKSYYETH